MVDLGYKDGVNTRFLRLYPIQEVPASWQELQFGKMIICGREDAKNREYLTLIQNEQELKTMKLSQISKWYCGLNLQEMSILLHH